MHIHMYIPSMPSTRCPPFEILLRGNGSNGEVRNAWQGGHSSPLSLGRAS